MASFFGKLFNNNKSGPNSSPIDRAANIRIATCAVLVEIANSDDEFSTEEKKLVIEILRSEYGLTDKEAENLIGTASKKIDESVDTWSLTNVLARELSEDERIKIMESVWKVIYADGKLSQHEDALVHKLSFLLSLTHEQMIAAKLKIKGQSKTIS